MREQASMDALTPIGTPLMAPWHLRPLGSLCSKISSGATPKGGSTSYTSSGISFIRSQNVFDHSFSKAGLAHIGDDAAARLANVDVEPRDVLLNITGDGETIARCCVVPEDVLPARVNQHVLIIRPHQGLVPEFLQRYLSHPSMREYMLNHNSGGSRRALTKGLVESFNIVLPPVHEQQAIAKILSSLDDKIAANAVLVELLDELAATEYELAVKEGGDTVRLADICEFHNRRRIPLSSDERDQRPGQVPYYGASGAFGSVDTAIFDERLVLVGEDGSVIRDDGTPVVQYIWGPAWVNNHAHVLTGSAISTEMLYYAIQREQVTSLVTGAVQPKINMGNLKNLEVTLPTDDNLASLEEAMASQTDWKRSLQDENKTLAATRDALLPHLMSGELRVKDAESIVMSVV